MDFKDYLNERLEEPVYDDDSAIMTILLAVQKKEMTPIVAMKELKKWRNQNSRERRLADKADYDADQIEIKKFHDAEADRILKSIGA